MTRRSGFTLLEVIISLAIFVSAFAAFSQLFTLGSRAAVQAALQTQAAVRAEAKMAEVVAGVELFEAAAKPVSFFGNTANFVIDGLQRAERLDHLPCRGRIFQNMSPTKTTGKTKIK